MIQLKYTHFFIELSKIMSIPVQKVSFATIESLYDILISDKFNGKNQYSLTNNQWKQLYELDSLYWATFAGGEQVTRLMNTKTFGMILNYLENAAELNSTSKLKWLMLSGHDANLMSMMVGLNITSYQCLLDKYFKN